MNKKTKIIIGAAIIIAIVGACSYFLFYNSPEEKYKRYLELGNRYFEEMDYELAEANMLEAIDIEPKKEDAYLALAGLYFDKSDYNSAIAILEQGQNAIGADNISQDFIDLYITISSAYADLLFEEEKYDKVEAISEALLAIDSDCDALEEKVAEIKAIKEKENQDKQNIALFEKKMDEFLASLTVMGTNWENVDMSKSVSMYGLRKSEFSEEYYSEENKNGAIFGAWFPLDVYETESFLLNTYVYNKHYNGEDLSVVDTGLYYHQSSSSNVLNTRINTTYYNGDTRAEGFIKWADKYQCFTAAAFAKSLSIDLIYPEIQNDLNNGVREYVCVETQKYGDVYIGSNQCEQTDSAPTLFTMFWGDGAVTLSVSEYLVDYGDSNIYFEIEREYDTYGFPIYLHKGEKWSDE